VAVNTGNASRSGTIAVQGQTHTISQAASGAVPGCTYTVSPQMIFIGEGKGSFGFTVTATPNTGCPWTAVSNNPEFITLEPKAKEGSGTGICLYSVNAEAAAIPLLGSVVVLAPDHLADRQGPIHKVTQAAGKECAPRPEPIVIGQTIYGSLSANDCRSRRGTALLADRYEFTVTEQQRVAINVASGGFDPFISLLRKIGESEVKLDDDGAGFRSARIPRLPAPEEFTPLGAGTYIIEVTSFTTNSSGNYGLVITTPMTGPEEVNRVPIILAAIADGNTLIVIGENFDEGAKLLVGEGPKAEKNTTNDRSRSRTALVALKSANKANSATAFYDEKKPEVTPPTLRVVNPNGKRSEVFVYPARP